MGMKNRFQFSVTNPYTIHLLQVSPTEGSSICRRAEHNRMPSCRVHVLCFGLTHVAATVHGTARDDLALRAAMIWLKPSIELERARG